jgi:hypothetical protein
VGEEEWNEPAWKEFGDVSLGNRMEVPGTSDGDWAGGLFVGGAPFLSHLKMCRSEHLAFEM